MIDLNIVVYKLLDMKHDPIPEYILLKEFKRLNPSSREYQNAYDRVCNHPFVKKLKTNKMAEGFGRLFMVIPRAQFESAFRLGWTRSIHALKGCLIILKKYLIMKKAGINSKNRTISAGGRRCLYRLLALPCFH